MVLGRFMLTHEQLRDLSGRTGRLEKTVITQITEWLGEEHKMSLVLLGASFGVIDQTKVQAWRKVPSRLVTTNNDDA